MDDLRGVNIMSLELALQRELAYRRKVAMLLHPSDSDFVSQLGSMEVQFLNAGASTTLSPSPSTNSGSSARLSGIKRRVPTTNSLESVPASLSRELENRVDQFFCKNVKCHVRGPLATSST
ncbi:uncharacterized protein LOC105640581 [Jatropha curcas]|uniref:uncharacterized protein LOC105640581 n=1 Tax=Jatropha curcas TaxID=180498 RepID=UPI0005FAF686|nr:uncharacterized protein LOC105640581 [Jatropha curcas]XP_012080326.1 uncharacterized protein LOC105640581 [Jatropha curcas]